ncbi:helix-turn-helix domain-containing protein [Nonomuraea rubra]|uniref:Transcriptional regulator with XRE-family HTH domain n=1 Tax=Nonomuraea rubra TaxID=46180 RepID=A0A7X0NX68_9ACTN|nr:helix-turn-helix transcriptional regulator [Nonomuraea rubra]MBB6551270.1 transcriptional regulator with XRE-family HTH domain [Nonomuraea rubra]
MGDDRSTSSEQPELSPHHREHDVRHYSEDNVALRLAWEMRRRGWSQERMAQELTNAGCPTHQSAISKIINPKTDGNRRTISVDEAIAMARVFGIPLEELPLPPESGEGRDLHDLTRTITHEGRNTTHQYAQYLLAWARLRHRLSSDDSRTAYEDFLTARKIDAGTARHAITFWLDASSWQHATTAYQTLHHTLQAMGTGHDLTPPTQDTRERASRVPDLLRLRDLFTSRIPGTPARVVPDLIYHFADLLVRTAMLETAVPVIDSYARGIPHPADDVVAEIDRRLQEIADRKPHDRADYLESLAARIGLRHQGVQPQEPVLELAAQLGVPAEDYREAKKISERHRETGVR